MHYMPKRRILKIGLIIILIYILLNIACLTDFPFVHSDESWLGGLSRNILETKDYSTTESFFDLYPRNPHAVKCLFHTLQIIFIKLLGYGIFPLRLLSLIFGILTLIWTYKLGSHILGSKYLGLACSFLLALDVRFIYATHFARQEIVLLFILIFTLHFFLSRINRLKPVHHLLIGLIIGLSIGLHPNSFIIFLPIASLYLFHIFITKTLTPGGFLIFITPVALGAAVFIALSLYFDPDFITHYIYYGSQFGVTDPPTAKISGLVNFYRKLYYGVSGTYYTPDIRLHFFLFTLACLITLPKLLFSKYKPVGLEHKQVKQKVTAIVLAILAINLGIIIIGRFNQTSIVFLFPLFYVLVIYALSGLKPKFKWLILLGLSLSVLGNSVLNIQPYLRYSYEEYLEQISKTVTRDSTVLANLNCEFYFDNGKLYDYRNLAFLKEKGLSFEQYIQKNNIEYIIYPQEMDFIYEQRPRWNDIYGNVYPYYQEMQEFMQNRCELVYEFTHPTYGIRIAEYINKQDWHIRIYKVRTNNSSIK